MVTCRSRARRARAARAGPRMTLRQFRAVMGERAVDGGGGVTCNGRRTLPGMSVFVQSMWTVTVDGGQWAVDSGRQTMDGVRVASRRWAAETGRDSGETVDSFDYDPLDAAAGRVEDLAEREQRGRGGQAAKGRERNEGWRLCGCVVAWAAWIRGCVVP